MKDDGFANFGLDFGDGSARGYTAWKIRGICRVVAFGHFNDDGVAR